MLNNSETIESDVLVIGGGLGGAFAAIKAREVGTGRVVLVSKGKLGKDSVTTFGAGVFEAAFPNDDKDVLFKIYALSDVFGGGLYDEEWLNIFLDEAYERVLDMERWGVEWERTSDGKLERVRAKRGTWKCMFHGPQLMEAMAKKVKDSGVQVVGHTMITDLLTANGNPGGSVIGAVGFDVRTAKPRVFKAKAVVLAAGGYAFKARFACQKFQTGEAAAMAYRAGAELGKFEIMSMHTTATDFDVQGLNMFAGLGGHFVNAKGERFLLEYDPGLGDYASMERLSESAAMEVRAGRGPIYLDMTHFPPENVKKMRVVLPLPTKILERAGIIVGDRIVRKIEWAPVCHGNIAKCAGVTANTRCETSLAGLHVCGDALAKPKHLMALPCAAITGARAGSSAAQKASEEKDQKIDQVQLEILRRFAFAPLQRSNGVDPDHVFLGVQESIFPYGVSIISRADRLENAIKEIERIRDEEVPLLHASDAHSLRLANEAISTVLVAEMFLRSRLLRKDSRDGCLREDYPYTDNINWLKWTALKLENGKMKLWTRDIPVDTYKLKPEKRKYLYPVFEVARAKGIKWG